ncbi:conserved hypothetical protein [Trichinella spiralis]|uniref:hypothetical protein n=1 Tax=Trichinella spiralis TaxID=6334 RepID=UPI0001EFB721|nr:conserved hypothetical protein [Trichinella spiralis]
MTTPVQQLIFAGLYSGRQFKVIGHLPLGAWLKQDDESSALCLHVQRLFHSLAAFAFHHTRLDVAVLEPKRLIAFNRCSSNYGIFDALCNFFLLRYSRCPLLSIFSKWRCIDPNGSLNTPTTTVLRKINELLEKFSFNTILLMVMMIEHLDKLVKCFDDNDDDVERQFQKR